MRLIVGLLDSERRVLPIEPQEVIFELDDDAVIRNRQTVWFPPVTDRVIATFFGLVVPSVRRGLAAPLDIPATLDRGSRFSFAPGAIQIHPFLEPIDLTFARSRLPEPHKPLSRGLFRLPARFTR